MTARIDRNRLFKILALEGQGSDAYLADQLEARIDEWLVESTAPVSVEPVLDLDTLERVILASASGLGGIADRIAAAVERHVAPILAAARQSTAPTDPSGFTIPTATPADPFEHVTLAEWTPPTPAELAKDPKVAAAVLRVEKARLEARTYEVRPDYVTRMLDFLRSRITELYLTEPVDPPTVDGQVRERHSAFYRRVDDGCWTCITNTYGYTTDEEMRGCRVVPTAEVITRLGLGGEQ